MDEEIIRTDEKFSLYFLQKLNRKLRIHVKNIFIKQRVETNEQRAEITIQAKFH